MIKKSTHILESTIAGIDYGSKYAGTTVICYNSAHKVRFITSRKNADADLFLLTELAFLKPDLILIDAPLSLPGVYSLGNGYEDHFFRSCDREINAMSPMFLGGITARAICLRRSLNKMESKLLETYPRKLVQILELPESHYKKKKADLDIFTDQLVSTVGIRINKGQVKSWHHMDALLAFFSGLRYFEAKIEVFGIKEEGQVFV